MNDHEKPSVEAVASTAREQLAHAANLSRAEDCRVRFTAGVHELLSIVRELRLLGSNSFRVPSAFSVPDREDAAQLVPHDIALDFPKLLLEVLLERMALALDCEVSDEAPPEDIAAGLALEGIALGTGSETFLRMTHEVIERLSILSAHFAERANGAGDGERIEDVIAGNLLADYSVTEVTRMVYPKHADKSAAALKATTERQHRVQPKLTRLVVQQTELRDRARAKLDQLEAACLNGSPTTPTERAGAVILNQMVEVVRAAHENASAKLEVIAERKRAARAKKTSTGSPQ